MIKAWFRMFTSLNKMLVRVKVQSVVLHVYKFEYITSYQVINLHVVSCFTLPTSSCNCNLLPDIVDDNSSHVLNIMHIYG